MSITVVQQAHATAFNSGSTNTTTVTLSSSVTAGNTLVASFIYSLPATSIGVAISGISDGVNSYSSITSEAATYDDQFGNPFFLVAQSWFAGNVAAGSTAVTVTWTVANQLYYGSGYLIVYEVSGLGTGPTIDSTNKGSSATFPPSINLTPVAANTFALGSFPTAMNNEVFGVTGGSGWTLDLNQEGNQPIGANSSWIYFGIEHRILSSSSGVAANFGSGDFSGFTGGWIGTAFTLTAGSGYSISGNAGVGNATVSYSGAAVGSVTANSSGAYTISGLSAGTYNLVASLPGYSFSPASLPVTISSSNVTNQNFTATSGNISVGWSPVDCRVAVHGFGPAANKGVVDEQGNVNYSLPGSQTPCNPTVPGTDSRVTKPTDCRENIPTNSRTAPPFPD